MFYKGHLIRATSLNFEKNKGQGLVHPEKIRDSVLPFLQDLIFFGGPFFQNLFRDLHCLSRLKSPFNCALLPDFLKITVTLKVPALKYFK